jgi:type IV secretion system protein VirB4
MSLFPKARMARREITAAQYIPYRAHVAPGIVCTENGDFVQVLKLAGASFESEDDARLNSWHERLNVLWRNIASPQVAIWAHVIRRRESSALSLAGGEGFPGRLEAKYRRKIAGETLMVNDLYVSLVYRPALGMASTWASRILARTRSQEAELGIADAVETCEKLIETVCASLARYEPEQLQVYELDSRPHSRLLEFLSYLVTLEHRRVPLPRAPLHEVLATGRLSFGIETIEYRGVKHRRLGAMLGIKEYPTPTAVGMFNRLLSAPFPFVLTQSFTFLSKAAGQGLLQRQFNRMTNAGDFARSQAEELKDALDALTSNEFVMGDHHFSLQVLADIPVDQPPDDPTFTVKLLNDRTAAARAMLADTGMTVAREDLGLEAACWAQLPGCFALRPRKAAVTSRNFAAMVPFHNFPCGRAQGNHWGEALTLLISSARTPFYFSLHASDPAEPDGGSRKDTGHTFICGPTGSGKSVLIGYLASTLARRGVTQVIFDKDRGLEILVRALGGEYQALKSGESTGFNPLQLPVTAPNVEFLKTWLRLLVRGADPLSSAAQKDLDQALMGTLALEPAARRLSRLIEFTDSTSTEGIHARLSPWCASSGGAYAHLFDNPRDVFVDRLNTSTTLGFDVTDFLDQEILRGPLTLYLFHLVRRLLDGRPLVCWMDEFWRLLSDKAFESFAKDGPKTWRKLNAAMCLATQSASDVLQSGISRTIIEQTPTKIFFPNPDADATEYTQGFGLSEREFNLVKQELEPGSRRFLIKQGHTSVVCQLDLKGFDAELSVISGRASEVARLHKILERVGSEPRHWLPLFMESELDTAADSFLASLNRP